MSYLKGQIPDPRVSQRTALSLQIPKAHATVDEPSRPRLYLPADEIAARRGSIPSLDGLRAFSILVVMLSHFISLRQFPFPGRFGVLVFFAISGFLITRLLFVEIKTSGKISLTQFYARRALRLYPVIIGYTAVVVTSYILLSKPIFWVEPLSAMFYFANYLDAHYVINHSEMRMPFAHFWSLSIEEHFYLLFPMILVITMRDTRKLVLLLIAVCLMGPSLRLMTAYLHPEYLGSFYFYLPSEFRLDSISYGVLLAIACETKLGRRILHAFGQPAIVFAALLLLLACFAIRNEWFRASLQFSMQSVGVAVLMAAIMFSNRYRYVQIILNLSPIKWVGVLSYSLYIWHFMVLDILKQNMPGAGNFEMASIGFFLSFLFAAISYYAIEKPFMRLRRRFGSQTV